jgi:hypothetical protein
VLVLVLVLMQLLGRGCVAVGRRPVRVLLLE